MEARALRVEFRVQDGWRTIIHDFTLGVEAGESVGLVGESGAGKSVSARGVMRLLPEGSRTEGDVLFDGESVFAYARDRLRGFRASEVAMIFQDPRTHVNPVRTIGDFLTEGMITNQGTPSAAARDRALQLLRDVEVDDVERRMRQYPHELSGGLLQRVMIAGALAQEPRLLLADEPTTALDVTTQAEVMGTLDATRRSNGLAMVFVTHDIELAAAACDRIAIMYAGFVVEDLPAESLYDSAMHPYTVGLLGSRPDVERRTTRLRAIPGRPLSAFEVGEGCPFESRCPFVAARCREERPQLRKLYDGRVRCHRAEELRGHLQEAFMDGSDG